MQFEVIPPELASDFLAEHLGEDLSFIYEQTLFNTMRRLAPGQYNGGFWELRKFQNGVFAYVLPSQTVATNISSINGMEVSCSLEAASIAANLFVFCGFNEVAQQQDGDLRFYHLFHGLRQLVNGYMSFVIENGQDRELTDAEQNYILTAHPECSAIMTLTD